jgi:hypothetical protein
LERRREWAAGRRDKAAAAFSEARRISDAIPFGQPILVGHHSERHARRDAERIWNGMGKGCASLDMAKHHESKAAGIAAQLERSVFSDDPDAVQALQAKIADGRTQLERMKACNKIVRKFKDDPTAGQAALIAAGFSERIAQQAFEPDMCGRLGFPSYELTNLGANIRRMEGRIEDIQRRQQHAEAAAAAPGGVTIEGSEWVNITFADKPAWEILSALREAGFRWGGGHWCGQRAKIPASVTALTEAVPPDGATGEMGRRYSHEGNVRR